MQNREITDLHQEHNEWLTELTHWHNELMFYNNLLMRLAPQEGDDKISIMENFKSQFDSMQEKLGKMLTAIEDHEKAISYNGSTANHEDAHKSMREKIKGFDSEFKTVKNEYFKFTDKEDY